VIKIRPFEEKDWDAVWAVIEPVFRAGETYAFSPDISQQEAFIIWVTTPQATFVATDQDGLILGTYILKPNQPALGAHVCNCGYIVSPIAQGQGVGTKMCQHSLRQAKIFGFRAMQYNFVVSTNENAVRLWQKLGFSIIGTLPGAFDHPRLGFVDAFVMFKTLET
jgi:ribosomal protein S18 acetylase RimI-like enzyme